MVDINAELQKLRGSRLMQQEGEYVVFEEAIERIIAEENVHHIQLLCQGFDDATEHHEVMFGLIHSVEHYYKIAAPELVTDQILKAIPSMLPHASEWAEIMLRRFLHKPSDRQLLHDSLSRIESIVWKAAVELLQKIAAEDPERYEQKVAEVIS